MPDNFSAQNLRGRSFRKQDLKGANFSKADLRGADFTEADLEGADFTGVKAGTQGYWKFLQILLSCIFAIYSGFASVSFGFSLVAYFFPTESQNFVTGGSVLDMWIGLDR